MGSRTSWNPPMEDTPPPMEPRLFTPTPPITMLSMETGSWPGTEKQTASSEGLIDNISVQLRYHTFTTVNYRY